MSDNTKTSMPKSIGERLVNGIFKENPTFVLLLGMCPTLATTTSAINGLGMGLTTMVVLAMSNMIIAALRKVIPSKIRIPAFIVIIASFVTIVELLLEAYIPFLYSSLGIYIPLIVVNCIILGRAEAYAYSHKVIPSLFDGIGMGLGFSLALTIIGGVREILGSGAIFGMRIMPESYIPVSIFVMAPGAFFVLAILTAIQNKIKEIGTKRGKDMSKIQSGCGGNCMECSKECKVEIAPVTVEVKNDEAVETEQAEETIKPEKTAKIKESAKVEKPAKAEESVKSEEPVKAEESVKVEKSEKAEEPAKAEESVKVEESEKAEEPAKVEEPVKVEELAVAKEPETVDEAVKVEEPVVAEEPVETEKTVTGDAPKKDVEIPEKTAAPVTESMSSNSSNFLTQKSKSDRKKKNKNKHKYNFSGISTNTKEGEDND